MSPSLPGHTPRDNLRTDFQFKISVSGLQFSKVFQKIAVIFYNLGNISIFGIWIYSSEAQERLQRKTQRSESLNMSKPGLPVSQGNSDPFRPLYSAAGSQPS